jgi:hypothetical protein
MILQSKPYFNASNVAALIGKHKYKTRKDAYRECLRSNRLTTDASIKLRDYERSRPKLEEFVPDIVTLVSDATIIEAQDAIQAQATVLSHVDNVLNNQDLTVELKQDILATVQSELNKAQGAKQEASVLQTYELEQKTELTSKNTDFQVYHCDSYSIGGRTDGIHADRVVEVKTRRNWFSKPPEYDLIQLRAYMHIFKKPLGILIEKQQFGDKYRETVIEEDDVSWQDIDAKLQQAASLLSNMSPSDLDELLRD